MSLPDLLPAVILTGYSLWKWSLCRYRLTEKPDGDIHWVSVTRTIPVRRTLYLCADDASSVEIERTPLLRLFGGCRVRIGTAALRHRAEVVLYLSAGKAHDRLSLSQERIRHSRVRRWPVLVLALSGSNAAVGLLTVAPLFRQASQVLGERFSHEVAATVETLLPTVLPPLLQTVAYLLLLGWMVSALRTLTRYLGFSARRENNRLHLLSGLFTRRDVLVDGDSVVALELRQTLGMRLLNLSTAVITAAGYGRDTGTRPVLIPAARPRSLRVELDKLLPEFPMAEASLRPSPGAWKRYLFWPLTALGAASGLWVGGGLWRPLALLGAVVALWWLSVRMFGYRQACFGADSCGMMVCYPRGLALYRVYLPLANADTITVTQSMAQRRSGLCTVRVRCFGEKRRVHSVWGLSYEEVCHLIRPKKTGTP